MLDKVKISSTQLSLVIIGFIFSESIISNPAIATGSDAWLVIILSLISGIVLIAIYSYISILNPGKTLIDILIDVFGKIGGNIIAVLYIWYFIHLMSLVLRKYLDFISSTIYTQTPIVFVAIILMVITAYRVKSGIEVMVRVAEIWTPIMIFIAILLFFALISKYDINYFFPFLENGIKPVLMASFNMMAFPYGELVVFLMIFPHLNKHKNIFKVASISTIFAAFLMLLVTVRIIMVLGPIMMGRISYPNFISAKFVPDIHIEVFIAINVLLGGATKACIILYSIVMGISQLFKLDDYKPLVMPSTVIVIAITLWLFDSMYEHLSWGKEIYPYYALPFQVIIPIYILFIIIIKNKMKLSK
ncbi:endospore germination permease [Mycoplasmatota bacterium]|nr:endospore germination permease [Mycoplasmatota bacterium]